MYYEKYKRMFDEFMERADDNWVLTIDSGLPWKEVSIMALTHGNEMVGLYVFDYLLNKFEIEDKIVNWKVNLIIWNYESFLACEWWKRYVDVDFNRIWADDFDKINTVEYKRKCELLPYIDRSNALLDIHSTSMLSRPMILPASNTDLSVQIAEDKDIDFILFNVLEKVKWVTIVWRVVNNDNDNIALAMESWQHQLQTTLSYATTNTIKFLKNLWCVDTELQASRAKSAKKIEVFFSYFATDYKLDYKYSQSPKSFDFIKAWSEILQNWQTSVYCPEDAYIIMPSTKVLHIWYELFYLWKPI